jgi:hypothetical protein
VEKIKIVQCFPSAISSLKLAIGDGMLWRFFVSRGKCSDLETLHATPSASTTDHSEGGQLHWIEQLFGRSPDNGSGLTELLLMVPFAIIALIVCARICAPLHLLRSRSAEVSAPKQE